MIYISKFLDYGAYCNTDFTTIARDRILVKMIKMVEDSGDQDVEQLTVRNAVKAYLKILIGLKYSLIVLGGGEAS